ncbi:MAG: hypothetical protein JXA42_06280 [Anaerolineales bacterium]|nr:hypothetical protein [Anaerolineales bacterium]
MKSLHDRFITSATQPCLFTFGCVVLGAFLFSCSTIPSVHYEPSLDEESTLPLCYSMVFIIHGDGDYLYHDPRGVAHRADEEAVAGAIRVAEQNAQAQVLIFHQKRRRHALLLFPLVDGEFYYYRHGKLLARGSYWRDKGLERLDPEWELYHRFHTKEQPELAKIFLYFGHEIPEFGGRGYDASYSNQSFTVHDLANALKRITRDAAAFDLIVLSTCFNGTPHTIATLAPYARTIVASPGNLHLSYLALKPFEQLEAGMRKDVPAFARQFAHQAFEQLTQDIQTEITVAVYDTERVQGYLSSVKSAYDHTLSLLQGQKPESVERCDCAHEPDFALPGMSDGVEVFYRPARFGRLKHAPGHSGWECWMLPN